MLIPSRTPGARSLGRRSQLPAITLLTTCTAFALLVGCSDWATVTATPMPQPGGPSLALQAGASADPYTEFPGMSHEATGAGMVLTNLDDDPRPDLILMITNNAPSPGLDEFRWRVGYNIDPTTGLPTSWLPGFSTYYSAAGLSWETEGSGIAFTSLDADPRPDMIFMAYRTPYAQCNGEPCHNNSFLWRVGYNVQPNGRPISFGPTQTLNSVKGATSGAGIAITSLDNDPAPDMLLMDHLDGPHADTFRYRVLYNLGLTGSWFGISDPYHVPGLTHIATSAGATVAQLDGNVRPELVFWAMNNPYGNDDFRWIIGDNLDIFGVPTAWRPMDTSQGMGWESQGSGIVIHDINGNGLKDVLLMYGDNPPKMNSFRYKVSWDRY